MSHTPGPWRLEQGMDDNEWADVMAGKELVCQCPGIEHYANAHLIAAAPELLEFVERLARGTTTYFDLEEMANALIYKVQYGKAIAKAEGKP